jgi:perosamine synthetase
MHFQAWPQPDQATTPIASPVLGAREASYVSQVLDSGWIGSNGFFSQSCETSFSDFFNRKALLVSNGTVALTLALAASGVGPGDEVLVPDLTFAATASAVISVGATPVFCDVELDTWGISVEDMRRKLTAKTRAVIVVHLYGMPARLSEIMNFASEQDLVLIEDAAEAFGATHEGRLVGTFGEFATFSFFPNKLLTSGEGGLLLCKSSELAELAKLLRGQGMSPSNRYFFLRPGYNFRLTELQSAILLAQWEKYSELKKLRAACEKAYYEDLSDVIQVPQGNFYHERAPWLFTARLKNVSTESKLHLASKLADSGIETRPVFYPLSQMPAFAPYSTGDNPNASLISREGISFPTGSHVDDAVRKYVVAEIRRCVRNANY